MNTDIGIYHGNNCLFKSIQYHIYKTEPEGPQRFGWCKAEGTPGTSLL